eukprot:GDKK01034896.1.p2 GENE.GDKK01034896.1~~GDKK01034896.1.p2  ORF type:complete len:103 (-),score=15.79 GDKK01034896.1:272-580(-)
MFKRICLKKMKKNYRSDPPPIIVCRLFLSTVFGGLSISISRSPPNPETKLFLPGDELAPPPPPTIRPPTDDKRPVVLEFDKFPPPPIGLTPLTVCAPSALPR